MKAAVADVRLSVAPAESDLLRSPQRALELAPTEAAAMLARVEGLAAVLRLAAVAQAQPSARPAVPEPSADGERWLTPDQAATLASVPRRTVYGWSRRADWRSFTRRLSRKVLRIEESGFCKWLDRRA